MASSTGVVQNIVFTTGPDDADGANGGGADAEAQFDLRSVDNNDDDLASAFSGSNDHVGGADSSASGSGITPQSSNGDETSSQGGGSTATGTTKGSGAAGGLFNRAGISKTLAKREERAIVCSKALMLLFLAAAAAAAAAATYVLFSQSQEETFESEFTAVALEVESIAGINVENLFSTLENLSLTITSYTSSAGLVWPFVVIPDFAARTSQLVTQLGATNVGLNVMVSKSQTPNTKMLWEQFTATNHKDWIENGYEWEGVEYTAANTTVPPVIYNVYESPSGGGGLDGTTFGPDLGNDDRPYYMPFWQTAPVRPDTVNWNPMNDEVFYQGVQLIESTGHGTLVEGLGNSVIMQPVYERVNQGMLFSSMGEHGSDHAGDMDPSDHSGAEQHSDMDHGMEEEGHSTTTGMDMGTDQDMTTDMNSSSDIAMNINAAMGMGKQMNMEGAEDGEDLFPFKDAENKFVGMVSAGIPWETYFQEILPEGTPPVHVVLQDECGRFMWTYEIDGYVVTQIAEGQDVHDPKYDYLRVDGALHHSAHLEMVERRKNAAMAASTEAESHEGHDGETMMMDVAGHEGPRATSDGGTHECLFTYSIYPTQQFEDSYVNTFPLYAMLAVLGIFILTSLIFIVYDVIVGRRYRRVEASATKTNAIVSSLFPAQVRDRLLETSATAGAAGARGKPGVGDMSVSQQNRTKMVAGPYLGDNTGAQSSTGKSAPIADLFPSATVMFADIASFTAWSSVREPTQVFMLLEEVYNSFDAIAKKRRVFKVETIGDSYVAVCGLPDPNPDHAIVMARFSMECIATFNKVVQCLERILGPETGNLALRVGLNSGQVTAGVLRGEKSRFQLFGDTVNTASRMESTGQRDKIQVSQSTADLITAGGKAEWLLQREDQVEAKGKGSLTTYWLDRSKGRVRPIGDSGSVQMSVPEVVDEATRKKQRLIDWNVDILLALLKNIVAQRDPKYRSMSSRKGGDRIWLLDVIKDTPRSEIKETIHGTGTAGLLANARDPSEIHIDDEIKEQLRDYITCIAESYRENPFHNFQHASHVTMSVTKLMSRIELEAPESDDLGTESTTGTSSNSGSHMHRLLTADPLTPFACALSALIHDLDHPGVSNMTLIEEKDELAQLYQDKSVAEQHSIDLAWDMLMEPQFEGLRSLIYTNKEELICFRELLVNSVMATDIMDKDLKTQRNERWAKVFDADAKSTMSALSLGGEGDEEDEAAAKLSAMEDMNRKATIVIDHLIQASDVSHTMQHWHVYLNWNEKFFDECYQAYLNGRTKSDPSANWYKGEIGFFDFYIIPLAKKLEDCGVFGVSSDEYLNYARANRDEWESKGAEIVARYLKKYEGQTPKASFDESKRATSMATSRKAST